MSLIGDCCALLLLSSNGVPGESRELLLPSFFIGLLERWEPVEGSAADDTHRGVGGATLRCG